MRPLGRSSLWALRDLMFDSSAEHASAACSTGFARAARSAKPMSTRRSAKCAHALIEADVALPVVKDFIDKVRPRAIGETSSARSRPASRSSRSSMTCWSKRWAAKTSACNLGSPPAPILMVGLQGSGKTTTSAKLGLMLQTREKKRVLMASLDVTRPPPWSSCACWASRPASPRFPIVAGPGPARHRQARHGLRQGRRL